MLITFKDYLDRNTWYISRILLENRTSWFTYYRPWYLFFSTRSSNRWNGETSTGNDYEVCVAAWGFGSPVISFRKKVGIPHLKKNIFWRFFLAIKPRWQRGFIAKKIVKKIKFQGRIHTFFQNDGKQVTSGAT